MRVRGKAGDQCSKTGIAVLALLLAGVTCGGVAVAQAKLTGGPSPSPAGAEVYFIDLKDGATVPANLKIYFGLRNMGVAPAGSDRENSGHHHLLIDTELPPLDQPIPNDFNHLHFGAGQTEAEITLKPGQHTLQLLLGDQNHIPHTPPVMSPRIRVNVALTGGPTASAPGAAVYFTDLKDGATVDPKVNIRFGLRNMNVVPAGSDRANSGHHHLLIDTELPPLDQPIPNDFNHLHFGGGQTEAAVTLKPGDHTLATASRRQGSHSAHAAGVFAAHQGPCRRRLDPNCCASGRSGLFHRRAEQIRASAEGDHSLWSCQHGRGAGWHRKDQHRPPSSPDRRQAASAGSTDPE